jgi:hypothetical protein
LAYPTISSLQQLNQKGNLYMAEYLFLEYIETMYPVCERSMLVLRGLVPDFPPTGDVSSELESSLLLLLPT